MTSLEINSMEMVRLINIEKNQFLLKERISILDLVPRAIYILQMYDRQIEFWENGGMGPYPELPD